jgi:hypothetical protein
MGANQNPIVRLEGQENTPLPVIKKKVDNEIPLKQIGLKSNNNMTNL